MLPEHLYPFRGKTASIGGFRMHYLDEGEGRPVLMVHGNPTWSFYYREVVKALRGRRRCIVPDHIGCGLSEKPPLSAYPYRLEDRVADLGALVDSLKLDGPIDLIVHDWGGMIGLAWAARNPEKVGRIVLLNTGAFPKPSTKRMPPALAFARSTRLGGWLVLRGNAFAWMATRVTTTKPLPPEVKQGYLHPYDSPENRIATLRFVVDIPLQPADPSYALVAETATLLHGLESHPALACWGEKDWVFDHHFLRVFTEIWPQMEVHRFPDAGHYVLEDERDAVIGHIGRFLGEDG